MNGQIEKVDNYFILQNEKLQNKIFEINQGIEGIKDSINELQEYILIIKNDQIDKQNIFSVNEINLISNNKTEQMQKKIQEFQKRMIEMNIIKDELTNDYEEIISAKKSFDIIKKSIYNDLSLNTETENKQIEEILNKIIICKEYLNVDKDRCKLELDNVIKKYLPDKNVSRETLK